MRDSSPSAFLLARAVFLRLLGVVYLAAFLSLLVQVRGLVGEGGIAPAAELFAWARQALGPERFWQLPSLFWLGASDTALVGACVVGAGLALLLLLGITPRWTLVGLGALYLSLSVAGDLFLSYQWDALLLESTLLAVFLAPGRLRPPLDAPEVTGARWLLRWLLVRLMVLSGLVKLLSGDPTWRNLTALEYHDWTQPLPHVGGYLAHQLPDWGQRASTVAMLGIELVVPLLLLGPRRLRHAACAALALLQVGIAATGNYGFFNLLTLALVLLNVDDSVWQRMVPERWRELSERPERGGGPRRALLLGLGAVYVLASAAVSLQEVAPSAVPRPLTALLRGVEPLRVVNGYGLFAVMTTQRHEIVLEGSEDGRTWRRYRLPFRPEDATERPRWALLHLPRLDWQLWFAALGTCGDNPWLLALQARLLQGAPQVLGLFAEAPFPPEHPPRFVRTRLDALHFTPLPELRRTGAWWTREPLGPYCPVLTLEDGQLRAVR